MNKRNVILTIISVLILTCLFAFARTTTTDLGLVKPTWTETTDILNDINANSDILEAFANDPLEFDTGERLEDRVGAMFSGNTETGLTLTYQDADNTIDVVIGASDIVESMLKVINAPTDEDIFTYESTTGDFEWHTLAELSIQPLDATLTALAGLTISANSLIYGTGADTFSVLATNATATNKFLREVSSGAPAWATLVAGDIPDISGTYQPLDTALTNISVLTYVSPSFIKLTADDTYAVRTFAEVKSDLSLNLVENTALSTWAGTSSITTLGTIGTGTWNGTAIADGYIPNNITIDLATLATTITVTDNEATAENNPICFVAGADPDGGSLGVETDGDLHYNPSTGLLTSTGFAGALSGNASTATTLATTRAIYGNNFDGSAALTQIIASTYGGTGNGFTKFSGATATEKTYTLPDASTTILTTNAVITPSQGGTGVANNAASTLTISGDFATTLTVTEATGVTLPASGTLMANLSEDTTPQLGGNLDVNDHAILDNVTAKTTTATLTVAESGTILVSASSAYTITLPTAVGYTGLTYRFKKTDANYNLITLDGDGTETLNYENANSAPQLTYSRLNTGGAEVTIISDGANWQCMNEQMGQVPEAWAYLGTTHDNLVNTTYTLMELDTESKDIGSNFNVTAGNYKFVAPINGEYTVMTNLVFTNPIANKRYVSIIYKNGAGLLYVEQHTAVAENMIIGRSIIYDLDATDYLQLYARSLSGEDTVDILGGNSSWTFLSIRLIAKD